MLRIEEIVLAGIGNTPDARLISGSRFSPREHATEQGILMPKRTDIHKIMVIGAGPIVIGQGCEFDYSGSQAVKAL